MLRAFGTVLLAGALLAPGGAAQASAAPDLSVAPSVMTVGGAGVVTVTGDVGAPVELHAAPAPSGPGRVVRRGVVPPSGRVSWTVTPMGNTRLHATVAGQRTRDVRLDVAHAVTLGVRSDAGTYRFSGVVRPGFTGLPVTLYRTLPGGAVVVTARGVTDPTGRYAIDRRFTGSGTFGFFVRTGASADNVAGRSRTYGLAVRAYEPRHNGIDVAAVRREAARQWRVAYGTTVRSVRCDSDAGPIPHLPRGAVFACRVDGPAPYFTTGFGTVTSRRPFFTFTLLTD